LISPFGGNPRVDQNCGTCTDNDGREGVFNPVDGKDTNRVERLTASGAGLAVTFPARQIVIPAFGLTGADCCQVAHHGDKLRNGGGKWGNGTSADVRGKAES